MSVRRLRYAPIPAYDSLDAFGRYYFDAKTWTRLRSVVDWADELNAPVLIMHARTDDKVPVAHALSAAAALQMAGKRYELVIYDQDGHSLPEHRADRVEHIVQFFRRYRVGQSTK